jgi:hypothetical protein
MCADSLNVLLKPWILLKLVIHMRGRVWLFLVFHDLLLHEIRRVTERVGEIINGAWSYTHGC